MNPPPTSKRPFWRRYVFWFVAGAAVLTLGGVVHVLGPAWIEEPARRLVDSIPPANEDPGHVSLVFASVDAAYEARCNVDDGREWEEDVDLDDVGSAAESAPTDFALTEERSRAIDEFVALLRPFDEELSKPELWGSIRHPSARYFAQNFTIDTSPFVQALEVAHHVRTRAHWAIRRRDDPEMSSTREILAATLRGRGICSTPFEVFIVRKMRDYALRTWVQLATLTPPDSGSLRPLPLIVDREEFATTCLENERLGNIEILRALLEGAWGGFGSEPAHRWSRALDVNLLVRLDRAYVACLEALIDTAHLPTMELSDRLKSVSVRALSGSPLSWLQDDHVFGMVRFDFVLDGFDRWQSSERMLDLVVAAHWGEAVDVSAPLEVAELDDGTRVLYDSTIDPAPSPSLTRSDCIQVHDRDHLWIVLPDRSSD